MLLSLRFALRPSTVLLACAVLAPTMQLRAAEPVYAKHAMVVSIQHDATDAGLSVLKAGGNAVDAAVATGFALAVTYPAAGNIGGGGFMMVRIKGSDGKFAVHFLDYRETAPAAASRDMYLDAQGNVVPGMSLVGYKANGVPGSVAGMVKAESLWGRLGLAKAMAPAIKLARDGFTLSEEEAVFLQARHLGDFPESKRVFQRGGNFYKAGDVFKQPDLARTLERIAAKPDDFYKGAMAQEIAASQKKGGGLITAEDLANYEAKLREPLHTVYRGYELFTPPPPSSGGIAMIEALNILSGYDLAKLGDRTPAEMHLILEAYRRAYMDRTDYLGDTDFVKVPLEQMASMQYAAAWRAGILPDKATPSRDLARPAGFLPPPPALPKGAAEPTQTTQYSVVDADGNAVSTTTTLNGGFGNCVTVDGMGFLMNNEMDDFASKAGAPNTYGLIQGPNNAIAPGKRPLSSMTPTIATKDGKLSMVIGSPGGATIITTTANIFLSVADEGLNIQDAVDAARFHHQYLPDRVDVDARMPAATIEALRGMGYTVEQSKGSWGDGECIAVDAKTGMLVGGHDDRHHFGKAAGY
ncbi:MAG: gamma-glutamyltransferase [Acidobacteriaceae bacterium]